MTINPGDWSDDPDSNASINGINIAEGCSPAGINNAARAIMAGVKTLYETVTGLSGSNAGFMPKTAGQFTGTQPIYTGSGAYHYNAANGMASAAWYIQAAGGTPPSTMQPGDFLGEY